LFFKEILRVTIGSQLNSVRIRTSQIETPLIVPSSEVEAGFRSASDLHCRFLAFVTANSFRQNLATMGSVTRVTMRSRKSSPKYTRGDSTGVGRGLDSSTAICAVHRTPREVRRIGSAVRRRVSQIAATTVFKRLQSEFRPQGWCQGALRFD